MAIHWKIYLLRNPDKTEFSWVTAIWADGDIAFRKLLPCQAFAEKRLISHVFFVKWNVPSWARDEKHTFCRKRPVFKNYKTFFAYCDGTDFENCEVNTVIYLVDSVVAVKNADVLYLGSHQKSLKCSDTSSLVYYGALGMKLLHKYICTFQGNKLDRIYKQYSQIIWWNGTLLFSPLVWPNGHFMGKHV